MHYTGRLPLDVRLLILLYTIFLTAEVPFSGEASIGNRTFYRYGGHIELIVFKKYYGMPSGHENDPIYSHQYVRGLFGPIFLFKKDRCAVFGCNNDILVINFFSRNIQ